MAKFLVLNGPNLNLLGEREPGLYGDTSLGEIELELAQEARSLGHTVDARQSNAEHQMVDWLHAARSENFEFMLLNPAAFTHTSVALRDAVSVCGIPFIEIHLSNIYAREPFRKTSYFSDLAVGVVSGLGAQGYLLALKAADKLLGQTRAGPSGH
ncbi:MAG: type II 3-dehydroquinate dehydratase [Gammaproteobacteria bacterium]|nr:type II 3-dehydroquinate dehydratase [Gammaproteobacteria bacterium]